MTKEINKQFYKHSVMCVLGQLLLFGIFVVGYDFGTGIYKNTLLPNGHCRFTVQSDSEYNTTVVFQIYAHINKIIQVLLLVAFFIYYYKLRKMLTLVHKLANDAATQQNQMFLKVGITIGAAIGISHMMFALTLYLDKETFITIAGFFIIIQQGVIMSFYIKKMSQLCKERFCTTETSP